MVTNLSYEKEELTQSTEKKKNYCVSTHLQKKTVIKGACPDGYNKTTKLGYSKAYKNYLELENSLESEFKDQTKLNKELED